MAKLPKSLNLEGRVALVTGAGSATGIGFAAARALAELGARVEIAATTDRIEERVNELGALGFATFGHVGDLTDEVTVGRMVNDVLGRHGHLDILVNNAGMVSVDMVSVDSETESGGLEDMSLERWRAGMHRNLDTAFLMSRAVIRPMIDAKWGRIVNVASVTGPVMAMRDEPAYAASKAAMVGLTRSTALDFAGNGITCNAVAPGWIETGSQTPHEAEQGRRTPIGRSANPAEVASTIAWLCTPGASYLTGQCLVVDGGNSISEERGL